MWNAGEADNNLSAAMFFCLKYLYEDEIPNWVKSLTEISHVLWQANLVVWTLGAFDLLNEKLVLPVAIEAARPQISWEHSHVLGSKARSEENDSFVHLKFNDNRTFLPAGNTHLFLAEVKKYFTEEKIVELADRFSLDEDIALSTFGIPERLFEKLFRYS
jgi:hypothetical protein